MDTTEVEKVNVTFSLTFPQVEPPPLRQLSVQQNRSKIIEIEGSQTEKLLDFSDEQKIAFPQALLLCAEVDDTFGLFNTASRRFPHLGKNNDENGNPLNSSFDTTETFDINNLSGLTSSDAELEEDEFFSQLKKANADKITKLKKMLLGTEPFPPPRRRPFLLSSISPLLSLHNTPLSDTAGTLDTDATPRCEDLPSQVVKASPAVITPPPADAILNPVHKTPTPCPFESPTDIIPNPCDKASSFTDTHSSLTVSLTPPSVTPSNIMVTPIPKEQPQDGGGKPLLTRSQSCTAGSGPRKFIPPIASSSPKPPRDLNRSASIDLLVQSQHQNTFTRKSVSNVKSSGYGRQTSRIPPPSPKCAQSPIRSRNSFTIGSPILRQPMGRPVNWNRETPPRSNKTNLDSTFTKDKKCRETTILGASNSGIPVASSGSDDKPSQSFHKANPSGLAVSKAAVVPSKKENISKMLNKYGFRK